MDLLQPIALQSSAPEQRVNPLLRRIRLPGESFTLPSRGLLYEPGNVLAHDVRDGELHVYPMTGIDELTMKSADKLFSGDAVREVFQRCIPQILVPGQLFAKDVDFLLTALRKVSYGPTIEVTYTHTCSDAKLHTYEVYLESFLRSSQALNPLALDSRFKFDCYGQSVQFKPATFDDIVLLNQHQQMQESGPLQTDEQHLHHVLYSISTVIKTVDEVANKDDIIEWLKNIPAKWLVELTDAINDTTEWGVEFDVTLQCKDCGEEIKVPSTLNPVSFFI